MKFRKSILRVGTLHSPDGILEVTPERLKHWATEFDRLSTESDVPMVPIDWDHADTEDELKPLSKSEFKKRRSAKTTVGHLSDFRLADDGQSAELVLDVQDAKAIEKANKNTVFASPVVLKSFKDGKGNEYSDVITHVDFVNHPVDGSQGPFVTAEPGTIACGLRLGLSSTVYRLSDDDPPPKDDDGTDGGSDGDADDTDTLDDDAGRLKSVIEALAQMDIVLSDDTNTSNLLAHLHQALLTAAAHRGEDVDDNPLGGGDKTMVADPGASGATALSLEDRGAIAWAQETHRNSVAARLEKLFKEGQCTAAEFKTHKNETSTIKLSLDSKGRPTLSDLEKFIEHREAVPRGTFWDSEQRTRMSAIEVEDAPEHLRGQMSKEEEKKVVGWALGKKPQAAT